MKIKPVVTNIIKTRHTSFEIELQLEYNITFVSGESGTGKTALYSFLEEYSAEEDYIRCFNYLDKNKPYKSLIENSTGKLIIIDNADILLDDSFRSYIAMDEKNQYIIIGRNPAGLLLDIHEIYELKNQNVNEKTLFTLSKCY